VYISFILCTLTRDYQEQVKRGSEQWAETTPAIENGDRKRKDIMKRKWQHYRDDTDTR